MSGVVVVQWQPGAGCAGLRQINSRGGAHGIPVIVVPWFSRRPAAGAGCGFAVGITAESAFPVLLLSGCQNLPVPDNGRDHDLLLLPIQYYQPVTGCQWTVSAAY